MAIKYSALSRIPGAAVLIIGLMAAFGNPKTVEGVDCRAPLGFVKMGSSESCDGTSINTYPIRPNLDDCHGWEATDYNGKVHLNSAKGIKCNADGSLTIIQYPNSINCGRDNAFLPDGSIIEPEEKTFYMDRCEQDIPPTIYVQAADLNCCTNPELCIVDIPSQGAHLINPKSYLNGEICDENPQEPEASITEPEASVSEPEASVEAAVPNIRGHGKLRARRGT